MELGTIELGRMGSNMVRRLRQAGHQRVVHDVDRKAVDALAKEGRSDRNRSRNWRISLKKAQAIRMIVPAAAVDQTLATLVPFLESDDVIIDSGNSYCRDDLRRGAEQKPKGIRHMDVGTSDEIWGSERGYCLMIGGEEAVVRRLDPAFAASAPSIEATPRTPGRANVAGTAEHGYLHCCTSGAGHSVRMVHSGIEYGNMDSYAEGLNILRHANPDKYVAPSMPKRLHCEILRITHTT